MSFQALIPLDETDMSIIEALQENGRLAISELGRRIGLSQPATSERVKRLEERGVISGYHAVVDAKKLGLGMMAVIRVRTTHENIQRCLRQFSEMPQILEVHRVTGEDCFVLKVIVPSPERLESIVDAVARHGAVTTSLVLRSEPVKILSRDLLRAAGLN
ncbi:MAG: Lrp/AsnC family transcriptional regulator [Mesorhizobium sp.]|uniref:Lrp/AsnC family transcriptional regulator n=1 Tax=unclassified Mesorhizobium TaxID=325217 RepID=UPI000F75E411|nr:MULTISPECIES: Lrp/AsnC family transcriptional regulator [unclassified Mesorhizobium]AZO74227.1 Lrp/AsnC family transcriptional regulator [Mesorhizobium sp. M1D.F.Ca.ET.043.01.1.1]RWA96901.1 MAG: winged helix-turn-helix transcriptional regulator [Mesorhizobium sp.]RWD67795.1 MAG: winged helix-turn-helix transcriptional regulator [Mesorhizobium sp.]RWE15713.1 MAG: winged helix-turn-helix transcriptional regulator [Mesorhizobium sp.]RWE50542.1 MAG: winged helix-turn-helix transcriptional regul